MVTNIPQLVPSDYCLQCRGCCVFQEASGDWQPRLAVEEDIALSRDFPGCASAGRLGTVPLATRHACVLLNGADHHCRAYARRPLECALYPFLISPSDEGFRLFVHQACPYAAAVRHTPSWDTAVVRVREFLLSPGQRFPLKAAHAVYPDYTSYGDEVELIGEIPFSDTASLLLEQRARLEQALAARRPTVSARSFIGLFSWADLFDLDLHEYDGGLCVLARQYGAAFLYFPPLGATLSIAAVERSFAWMGLNGAARIEGVMASEAAAFDPARYEVREHAREFVYDRAATAALAGQPYRTKRSDLNQFLKKARPVFRPFLPSDAPGCHALFEQWLDNRARAYDDTVYQALLRENRIVHRRLIGAAGVLGLTGRVVEIDGRIAAYSFGYPLNDEMFCVALEVAAPGVRGLPVFIFREFAGDAALRGFRLLNAMDDFGMPSVAAVKRSWRPVTMESVYSVIRR